MKTIPVFVALAAAAAPAWAQTPPILLEARNAMESAAKRLECLRAANGVSGGAAAGVNRAAAMPQPLYTPSVPTARRAATSPGGSYTVGGKTCDVGPAVAHGAQPWARCKPRLPRTSM